MYFLWKKDNPKASPREIMDYYSYLQEMDKEADKEAGQSQEKQ